VFICFVFINDIINISDCIASNGKVKFELWVGNYLEGSGCGLIQGLLSQYLPGGTEVNHEQTAMIADSHTKI
jgi:hypothetical protein